eukprot:15330420-Ditylum_brightwellii.AAC.2
MLKTLEHKYTVADLPADRLPMKCIVTKGGKLNIATNKKNSLINFISIVPSMTTRAATQSNIQIGFTSRGIINKEFKQYPDFKKC